MKTERLEAVAAIADYSTCGAVGHMALETGGSGPGTALFSVIVYSDTVREWVARGGRYRITAEPIEDEES